MTKMVCTKKGAWTGLKSGAIYPFASPNYGEIVTVISERTVNGERGLVLAEYTRIAPNGNPMSWNARHFRPINPDEPTAAQEFDFRKLFNKENEDA